MKKISVIVMVLLACFSCTAHRGHHHYRPHRPARVVVVASPLQKAHVANRLSKEDRLAMAIAYLDKNKRMSVKTYAKMTGLDKAVAEAELDAFVFDRNIPIAISVSGKKKVYVPAA